jgi:uncharacterized protein YlxW (UPF0749 family)
MNSARLQARLDHAHEMRERDQTRIRIFDSKIRRLHADKGMLFVELDKANASKDRLQSLCRDLQTQNKSVTAEARKNVEEEITRRKELTEKFSATVEVR